MIKDPQRLKVKEANCMQKLQTVTEAMIETEQSLHALANKYMEETSKTNS